jgi:predicted dehydrogenase
MRRLLMSVRRLVRFGVVGCGDVANASYLPTLREKAELIATCDVMEERARRSKENWGAREYYTNYDEMLEKADIEAVVITTPHATHANLVIKAARAGKHVLVQKPLATTMEDADAAVNEVRKAKVKTLVEPAMQLFPANQKAKELIEEEAIGKLFCAQGRLGQLGPTHSKWFFSKEHGGPLFDLGVYPIATLTYLLGPVKKVTCMATISMPKRLLQPPEATTEAIAEGKYIPFWQRNVAQTEEVTVETEDNVFAILDFGNGLLGCIIANWLTVESPPKVPGVEIYGTEGSIFLGGESPLALYTRKKNFWGREIQGWFMFDEESLQTSPESRREASLEHLINCILNDKEPLPSVEWGRHVAEIMVKSMESARSGLAAKLSTTF